MFGPRSDEREWSAVFGYNLRPQIWKKMPRRLAKRLSAGFQAKESQPHVTTLFNALMLVSIAAGKYCAEILVLYWGLWV